MTEKKNDAKNVNVKAIKDIKDKSEKGDPHDNQRAKRMV
jgi:hypothetical protein